MVHVWEQGMYAGDVDLGLADVEFVVDLSVFLGDGVQALHRHRAEGIACFWIGNPVAQHAVVDGIDDCEEHEQ